MGCPASAERGAALLLGYWPGLLTGTRPFSYQARLTVQPRGSVTVQPLSARTSCPSPVHPQTEYSQLFALHIRFDTVPP